MKTLWTAVGVAAIAFAAASAQDTLPEAQLLRAENKLLKRQIDSLKQQIESLTAELAKTREDLAIATDPTRKMSATQPSSGPVADAVAMTFSIYDRRASWWSDPATFALEVALRQGVEGAFPEQSAELWLYQRRLFAGTELSWPVEFYNVISYREETAGSNYYRQLKRHKSDQKMAEDRTAQLEKLKETAPKPTPEQLEMARRGVVRAVNGAGWSGAEVAVLKKLADAGGGGLLRTKVSDALQVLLPVTGEDVTTLTEYSRKPPAEKGPLRVSGKVMATRILGSGTVEVMLDGTWQFEQAKAR